MQLSGIISISGKAGLSKIISKNKNGIIVESLIDGKRFPVQGNLRVSTLEDISIYSYDEDILLSDVFAMILKKENGKACISHKSDPSELKKYFRSVLENFDEERVYQSDIKKVIQWYNLLLEKGILELKEEKPKKESKAKKETQPKKEAKAKAKPKKAEPKEAKPKKASKPKKDKE
jgi:hypothetical protein